ncbi:MAG: sigma factor-like helix-turn-helix DNA-binding protein [Chloroflexota bacterium]
MLRGGSATSHLGSQRPGPADRRAGRTRRPRERHRTRSPGTCLPAPVAGAERDLRAASPRGPDPAEIAEELGVPLGTVKSRLHYATDALRAALDADARTATTTERLA